MIAWRMHKYLQPNFSKIFYKYVNNKYIFFFLNANCLDILIISA